MHDQFFKFPINKTALPTVTGIRLESIYTQFGDITIINHQNN